jgi:hypothetical protein
MEVASQGNKWGEGSRKAVEVWMVAIWFLCWGLMDLAGAVLAAMVFFDRNQKKE